MHFFYIFDAFLHESTKIYLELVSFIFMSLILLNLYIIFFNEPIMSGISRHKDVRVLGSTAFGLFPELRNIHQNDS